MASLKGGPCVFSRFVAHIDKRDRRVLTRLCIDLSISTILPKDVVYGILLSRKMTTEAHNLDHSAAGTIPRHQPIGLDRGSPRVISEDDIVTFQGSRTSLWHFS